jgi:hypothetical protein
MGFTTLVEFGGKANQGELELACTKLTTHAEAGRELRTRNFQQIK